MIPIDGAEALDRFVTARICSGVMSSNPCRRLRGGKIRGEHLDRFTEGLPRDMFINLYVIELYVLARMRSSELKPRSCIPVEGRRNTLGARVCQCERGIHARIMPARITGAPNISVRRSSGISRSISMVPGPNAAFCARRQSGRTHTAMLPQASSPSGWNSIVRSSRRYRARDMPMRFAMNG